MPDNMQPTRINWHLFTSILALLTISLGLMGICGWLTGNKFLLSFLSDGASMKVNTALILIAGGTALLTAYRPTKVIGITLSVFIALLSLLIITEHLFNIDLRIDQLLIKDHFTNPGIEVPGRTSILTAFNSLMLGVSLLMLLTKKFRLAQLLAAVIFIVVYISLMGHIFHISGFYYLGRYSGIAFHTALGLLLAAAGVLTISSAHGWVADIYHRVVKGKLIVYFLSYFLGAAPLFAAIYLFIIQENKLSPASDVIVLVVSTAILSLPVAYFFVETGQPHEQGTFKSRQ